MIAQIVQFFVDLFNRIAMNNPAGIVLFTIGAVIITTIHIIHFRTWESGLKGANRHFEAPEICIYLFTWIFPYTLMADQYLGLHPSIYMWYFMSVLLLFGLTGRFGLEWLLAIKNGGKLPPDDSNKKEEEQPPKI